MLTDVLFVLLLCVAVACGRHHTVALTDAGSIWSWGWGKSGQLGHGGRYDQPLPVKIDDDFMSTKGGAGASLIACGDKHTVYISRDGSQAYSFGCGEHGQTGHGRPENRFEPTLIEALADKKISTIGCGPIHTGFVTKEGAVFMCGFGEFFYSTASTSAGLNKTGTFTGTATLGASGEQPSDAAAAEGGEGSGESKAPVVLLSTPGEPSFDSKAASLTAGGSLAMTGGSSGSPSKTLNLTAANQAAAAGAGHSNLSSPKYKSANKHINTASTLAPMLGSSSSNSNHHTHFAYLPRLIVFPPDAAPVTQIACGQSHNLVLTAAGQVYSWGAGDYGQLGHGIRWSVNNPRLVLDSNSIHLKTEDEAKFTQPMRIACVSAGRYHSFALTNAGVLYGWGCNENGQLGIGAELEKRSGSGADEDHVLLPTSVGSILGAVVGQVSCGEHHTAVLTSARWMKLSPDVVFWKQQDDIERDLKMRLAVRSHRPLTKKDLLRIQDDLKAWRDQYEHQKQEAKKRETEELKAQVNSISYKELDLISTSPVAGTKKPGGITLPAVAVDDLKKTGEGDSPGTPSKRRQSVTVTGQKEPAPTSAATIATLQASASGTKLPSVKSRDAFVRAVADEQAKEQQLTLANGGFKRGRGAAHNQKEDDTVSVNSLSPSQGGHGMSPSQRSQRSGHGGSDKNGVGSEYSFYQGQKEAAAAAALAQGDETGRISLPGGGGSAPVSRSQFLKETAAMVKTMTKHVTSHHGEVATSKQLNDKIREVFALREKCDKMRHRVCICVCVCAVCICV